MSWWQNSLWNVRLLQPRLLGGDLRGECYEQPKIPRVAVGAATRKLLDLRWSAEYGRSWEGVFAVENVNNIVQDCIVSVHLQWIWHSLALSYWCCVILRHPAGCKMCLWCVCDWLKAVYTVWWDGVCVGYGRESFYYWTILTHWPLGDFTEILDK